MRTLKCVAFAAIALAAASALSACAGGPGNIIEAWSTASDSDMHRSAAGMLGYSQDQLRFGENMRVGDRTSFDVTTPEGIVYRCTIQAAYGFVNHTNCPRKS
ncbi:MAG TPA: hypothetical protein VGE23_02290 [Candidatus Paceibacterota bacterium]